MNPAPYKSGMPLCSQSWYLLGDIFILEAILIRFNHNSVRWMNQFTWDLRLKWFFFQDGPEFESRDQSAARGHEDHFSLNPNFFEKFSGHTGGGGKLKLTPRRKRDVAAFKPSPLVRWRKKKWKRFIKNVLFCFLFFWPRRWLRFESHLASLFSDISDSRNYGFGNCHRRKFFMAFTITAFCLVSFGFGSKYSPSLVFYSCVA